MATKPINRYTVQESSNLLVYENYSSDTISINETDFSSDGDETTDWSTSGDGPAKEVMIVFISGQTGDTISMKLKIAGTYGDQIDILGSSLPFTINGLLIERIAFATDDTGTNEVVEVISFH